MSVRRFNTADAQFPRQFEALRRRGEDADLTVETAVRAIIDNVRRRGDAALLEYTQRFDRVPAGSMKELEVAPARIKEATGRAPAEQVQALRDAAERIRTYHRRQKLESWQFTEADGSVLGQKITPLDRVGLYVPGGKAAYPSSVLMNAIPAKLAGVPELIMTVPAPDGVLSDLVLAAAGIAGVDRMFTLGGAQAVAALAYGTDTIPRVDKIVGPGNVYVATAKRLVFGQVAIDMIAGPSEIVVVCDGGTDADWVAMDLFSQAEHDEQAQAILISPNAKFLDQVQAAIGRLLETLERRDIIRAALAARGALIQVQSLDEAAALVNAFAPEHLELSVADPEALLAHVRHAGAIFLGRYTAEALGDYCAGPNHVLPTAGSARFSSPLGVYDFQKRSSIIQCSAAAAARLGETAARLARGEGLTAHARSAEYRMQKK